MVQQSFFVCFCYHFSIVGVFLYRFLHKTSLSVLIGTLKCSNKLTILDYMLKTSPSPPPKKTSSINKTNKIIKVAKITMLDRLSQGKWSKKAYFGAQLRAQKDP